MTINETEIRARKLLVYLIFVIVAVCVAACYTWLSRPSSYIGASLLIGVTINAVFEYGMRAGRKDSESG